MNNKKRNIIILVFIFALTLVICSISYLICGQDDNSAAVDYVKLYYFNTVSSRMETENLSVSKELENEEKLGEVLNGYISGPRNTNLYSFLNKEVSIEDVDFDKAYGYLTLDFSKGYNELSLSSALLLRGALTYTFTELDFVNGVKFTISGKEIKNTNDEKLGVMNRNTVATFPSISPDKINRRTVVLYFANGEASGLVAQTRNIEVKQSQNLEVQIVEQLIAGPDGGVLFETVPPETKVLNVKTEEDICYVSLSNEFITKHSGGSSAENLTIYSIVNSLTELDSVSKVQFLVEGEKITEYKGNLDISKPFERDENLIVYEE